MSYPTGYVLLSKAALPLSLLSVHKSTVVRMHRLMLYSLRVGSEATDEGKAMLQPVLQHELREFEVGAWKQVGTGGAWIGARTRPGAGPVEHSIICLRSRRAWGTVSVPFAAWLTR